MRRKTKYELNTDYSVDQAILDQNNKILIIGFYPKFYQANTENYLDSLNLFKKEANLYKISTKRVKEFNIIYEINDNICFIFYFENKKIFVDSGSGDNNKVEGLMFNSKYFKRIVNLICKNCMKGKNFTRL
jgi:DIM1 family U5 snRNP protein